MASLFLFLVVLTASARQSDFLTNVFGIDGEICTRASIKWASPQSIPASKSSKSNSGVYEDQTSSASNDDRVKEPVLVSSSDFYNESFNLTNNDDLDGNED